MKRLLRLFAVGIALSGTSAIADDFTSNGTGVWAVPGTWTNTTPGGTATVPNGAGDNVTIGHNVTLNTTETIGNIVGNAGGLFGSVGNDLTVEGTINIATGISFRIQTAANITTNGEFNWGSQNSASQVTSTFNLNDTTNLAVANSFSVTGVITNNGTFNRNASANTTLTLGAASGFVNAATGTFNKLDGNNFTITGNTFENSGDINVSGGSLIINNYVHTGGTITVSNGATFDADVNVAAGGLEGIGNVTGNVTLDAGTALAAGTSGTAIGTLAVTGNLTLNDTTTLSLDIGDGTFDLITVTGDANINGADVVITLDPGATYTVGQEFTFLTATGGNATDFGTLSFANKPHPDFDGVISSSSNQYKFTITAVPEPSSLAVLGLVSVGAIARRRRRA